MLIVYHKIVLEYKLNILCDMDEKIIERLITINLVLFVIGCFIAGTPNPDKWYLFDNWFGRFLVIILEYFMIVKFPVILEKLKK